MSLQKDDGLVQQVVSADACSQQERREGSCERAVSAEVPLAELVVMIAEDIKEAQRQQWLFRKAGIRSGKLDWRSQEVALVKLLAKVVRTYTARGTGANDGTELHAPAEDHE